MIMSDMIIFMALFSMFLANYGLAMYVCYPRTGSREWQTAPAFNNIDESLLELFQLAFMGNPIKIFFLDEQEHYLLRTSYFVLLTSYYLLPTTYFVLLA